MPENDQRAQAAVSPNSSVASASQVADASTNTSCREPGGKPNRPAVPNLMLPNQGSQNPQQDLTGRPETKIPRTSRFTTYQKHGSFGKMISSAKNYGSTQSPSVSC